MRTLDKLERRFGHWAIPNVMLYLVVTQLLVYALALGGVIDFRMVPLDPALVVQAGEYWRLVTFIIAPPYIAQGAFDALFLAIFWYILWMMSSTVEATWGTFRFNLYLLLGVIFTIAGSFIGYFISPTSEIVVFPDFLYLSIFFAFAALNPNFEFYLLFILPVKVKWLAMLSGIIVFFSFIGAPSWGMRLAIIAPVLNFLLFFREAFLLSIKASKRRTKFQNEARKIQAEATHSCVLCSATDKSHPDRDFRYREVEGEEVAVCNECREAS
ncbi:MAG: hypothetical protein AAF546_08685 [Verrucomicrobiota bacterium]